MTPRRERRDRIEAVAPDAGLGTVVAMAFATDLTNRQWALVSDLFDPPGRRGAPARIARRSMANAVLYQARTGCQWRFLPVEFGPWGGIWQQFRRWRAKGVWAAAMDRLRRASASRRPVVGLAPRPSPLSARAGAWERPHDGIRLSLLEAALRPPRNQISYTDPES